VALRAASSAQPSASGRWTSTWIRAPAATALMNQYRCYVCHADTEPKAGPAFADVAAAYRGKPKAQSTVAAVIRRGQHGGGPWHMPPHPEISAAEANTIARYILALPLPADRAN